MRRFIEAQQLGGLPVYNSDIISVVQKNYFDILKGNYKQLLFGSSQGVVINGCEVTDGGGGLLNVSEGLVFIDDDFYLVNSATGLSNPSYIVPSSDINEQRTLKSGVSTNVLVTKTASFSSSIPSGQYINVNSITNNKGFNNIIDGSLIRNESLTSSKIQNGTITDSDLSNTVQLLKTDSYSAGNIRLKVVEIGSWNMLSQNFKTVTHGLTLSNIIGAIAWIRNDDYTRIYNLNGNPSDFNFLAGSIDSISINNIQLGSNSNGFFASTSFDSTSINRGWVSIYYVS
jgi:hypothetical protein